MSNPVRIQFDMPKDKVEKLENLMEKCGVKTRRDFFNNAITILEWAIQERSEGYDIASMNKATNSYRELRMPILSHIASS